MASPLTRTIETACLGFGDVLRERPDVKFLLVPMAQEIANQPCDIGYAPAELKQRIGVWLDEERMDFGVERMDWGLVHEDWNSKVCVIFFHPLFRSSSALLSLLSLLLFLFLLLLSHISLLYFTSVRLVPYFLTCFLP